MFIGFQFEFKFQEASCKLLFFYPLLVKLSLMVSLYLKQILQILIKWFLKKTNQNFLKFSRFFDLEEINICFNEIGSP